MSSDPAPSPVPDARRSQDGGMALVKAAVKSANDAIIITEAQLDAPGPRIEYVNGIALTAFARAEDRQLALRAGFQTHVTKPAEASELINVIANLASLAR